VAKFALAHGFPLRTPVSLKSAEAQAEFAALKLDAAVVVAYGLLLPKPILAAPRLGCFNLHASLLPRWRGAAPIQRAIMAGDKGTGVMAMRMEEGLDTGAVLIAERVAIGRKTCGELQDELSQIGAALMTRALEALEKGEAVETPQPEAGATYAKKILKEETRIDWSKSADEIDCMIRAFSPVPGAWCEVKGERLKILYAEPQEGLGAPGEILDNALAIACGTGALRLLRLQRAGRGVVSAKDFLRGFALTRGERLA
jgi:methionyl-tRNA formyltransferase